MKIILIVNILFFCCVSTFGQKQELVYVNYDWFNDSLKKWEFKFTTIISKTYAVDGKLIRESQGNGFSGSKGQEILYEYDSKGRRIKKELKGIGYGTDKSRFSYSIAENWSYNEIDSLSSYSFSRFDFSQNAYLKEFSTRYLYNGQNLLSETIYSNSRNVVLGDFEQIDYAKVSYFYNEKKQLIRDEYLNLPSLDVSKREYTYNQNGYKNQELSSFYIASSKYFTGLTKKEYDYDKQGNLILILNSGKDANVSPLFIPSTKQTFEFNKNKQEVLSKTFWYQTSLNNFIEFENTKSEYNVGGFLLLNEKRYLVRGIEPNLFEKDTVYLTKTYQYFPDNKLKEEVIINKYKGSTSGDRLRYEYQTSENTAEIGFADSYVIHPNPATDKIIVENTLSDGCLESVALHELSGKQLLYLERTYAPFCQWEVALPLALTTGIYLLYLKSYDGKTTGKKLYIQR